jgi:hypothetical protein
MNVPHRAIPLPRPSDPCNHVRVEQRVVRRSVPVWAAITAAAAAILLFAAAFLVAHSLSNHTNHVTVYQRPAAATTDLSTKFAGHPAALKLPPPPVKHKAKIHKAATTTSTPPVNTSEVSPTDSNAGGAETSTPPVQPSTPPPSSSSSHKSKGSSNSGSGVQSIG